MGERTRSGLPGIPVFRKTLVDMAARSGLDGGSTKEGWSNKRQATTNNSTQVIEGDNTFSVISLPDWLDGEAM